MQGILLYALRRTLITIWIIKTMTLIQLPTTINVTLLPILYLHFLGRKYHILSESFGKRCMPVSRHSVWCLFIIIYRVGDPSSAGRLTIYWSQILGPWSLGLPSLLPTQVSPQCRCPGCGSGVLKRWYLSLSSAEDHNFLLWFMTSWQSSRFDTFCIDK